MSLLLPLLLLSWAAALLLLLLLPLLPGQAAVGLLRDAAAERVATAERLPPVAPCRLAAVPL